MMAIIHVAGGTNFSLLSVAVSFVLVGMVDYRRIDPGAPIASAFSAVGAGRAAVLVSLAAVAGLTSVILVDIVAIGRIGFAMARDGLLPPAVGADLVSIGTLFAFVIVSLAVPLLRRSRRDLTRPFRVPLSPVIPALSALACLYLMRNLSLATRLRFAGWLVVGMVVYLGYGRRHNRLARRERRRPAILDICAAYGRR